MRKLLILLLLIPFVASAQVKIHELRINPYTKDSTWFVIDKQRSSTLWETYRLPIDSLLNAATANCYGVKNVEAISDSIIRITNNCDSSWDVLVKGGDFQTQCGIYVDSIWRVAGIDSIYWSKNGTTHSLLDSIGGTDIIACTGISNIEAISDSIIRITNNCDSSWDILVRGGDFQTSCGIYVDSIWRVIGTDSIYWSKNGTTHSMLDSTGAIQVVTTNSLDIYHENVEWATSTNVGNIDPASTTFPCSGTLSIEGTTVGNGDYIKFDAPVVPDYTQYNYLVFKISSKGTWAAGRRLRIRWLNGSTLLGVGVNFTDGSYGFKSNITDSCQLIYIPLGAFGDITGADNLRIVGSITSSGTVGYFIDDIILQYSAISPIISGALTWDETMRNSPDISQDYFSHFNSTTWTIDSIMQLRIHVQDWVDIIGDRVDGITDGREYMLKMHVSDAPYNVMWYGNSTHVDERYSPLIGGYASSYPYPNQMGALNFRGIIDPENDYYDEDTATNAIINFAIAATHDRDNPGGVPLYKVYHRNVFAIGGVTPGALTEYYLQISSGGQLRLAQYPDSNYTGTPIAALGIDALGNVIKIDTSSGGGGSGSADRFGKEDILAAENRTFDLDSHDYMLRDLNYTGGNGIRNRIRSTTFQNTWGGVDGNFFVDVADYPDFNYENYLEIAGGSGGHLNFFSASPTDGEGNGFWIDKDSVQFHRRGTGSPELIFKLVNLPAGDGSESAIGVMADGKVVKTTGGGGSADRFGIEDVAFVSNRYINGQSLNMEMDSLGQLEYIVGNSVANSYGEGTTFGLYNHEFDLYTKSGVNGSSIGGLPLAVQLHSFTDTTNNFISVENSDITIQTVNTSTPSSVAGITLTDSVITFNETTLKNYVFPTYPVALSNIIPLTVNGVAADPITGNITISTGIGSETDAIALAKTITENDGYGLIETQTATQALSTNPSWTRRIDTFAIETRDRGLKIVDSIRSVISAGTVTGANPTATIGLSVVNGSAATFMRSDAAPPLSQSITPNWTGGHLFSNNVDLHSNVFMTGLSAGSSTDSFVTIKANQVFKQPFSNVSPFIRGVVPSITNTLNVIQPRTLTDTVWMGAATGLTPDARYSFNGTGHFYSTFRVDGTSSFFGAINVGAGMNINTVATGSIAPTAVVSSGLNMTMTANATTNASYNAALLGTAATQLNTLSTYDGKNFYGVYGTTGASDNSGLTNTTTAFITGVYGLAFSQYASGSTQSIDGVSAGISNKYVSQLTSYQFHAKGASHGTAGTGVEYGGLKIDSIASSLAGSVWGIKQIGNNMTNFFAGSVNIGYNGSSLSTSASALVQVNSTTQGFLPPRMTTTQRDAISSPAEGLVIYNTSLHKHEGFDGTTWNDFY